jgi:pilus assembly protein CpaE
MGKDSSMNACEGLLIVASPEALANIPHSESDHSERGVTVFACASEDPIPLDLISGAKVIVVEVDQGSRMSIERLAELARAVPEIPRIAAIADASVPFVRTLMHEGVADVVGLPFQFEEVLDVAARTIELARQHSAAEIGLAPVISILGSTGGAGSTSIATHLAAHICDLLPDRSRIALVDFDLQMGNVADYLALPGTGSVSDLLQARERLDEDLLHSIERPGQGGLAIFAAPERIEPIESVDTDQVLKVLALMRHHYAGLVLDLPPSWTNWSLSAVSMSDLIIMVVELNVNSLRQAKRQIQLFSEVGIDSGKVAVIVNRVERRLFKTIDLSDVKESLRCQVLGTVSLDEQQLSSAQARGLLTQQINRKNKFNLDLSSLASELVGLLSFRSN